MKVLPLIKDSEVARIITYIELPTIHINKRIIPEIGSPVITNKISFPTKFFSESKSGEFTFIFTILGFGINISIKDLLYEQS